MKDILAKYIPEAAVDYCFDLIVHWRVHLQIVNDRKTKHGDYRKEADGKHRITVNGGKNKYRFLMTLVHEIAHLTAFEKYGRRIKPHGLEWKHEFRTLMLPVLNTSVFPSDLLQLLARHLRNPSASDGTDVTLTIAFKQYDPQTEYEYLFTLPYNSFFQTPDGRVFRKVGLIQKLIECTEVHTGRRFKFRPNAEVKQITHEK